MKTTGRAAAWTVVTLLALAATPARGIEAQVHDGAIDGRISDSSTNQGIPGMTVKLTPPKSSPVPQIVTRTDADGRFDFGTVRKGRYLLQVFQGTTLLYRRVIDSSKNSSFVVQLRPKAT